MTNTRIDPPLGPPGWPVIIGILIISKEFSSFVSIIETFKPPNSFLGDKIDVGLAVASPVRLEVDKALEEVGDVEEALHDVGVGATQTTDGEIHPGGEMTECTVGVKAVQVL